MNVREFDRLSICDIPLDYLTMKEAVDIIAERIRSKTKTTVFTPNVDHVVKAYFDEEFKKTYAGADLSLVDGMPLVWVSRIFEKRLPQRINGTNLVLRLCDEAGDKGFSLFLLGSNNDITRLAADKMQTRFPRLKIAGYYSPPLEAIFDEDEVARIRVKVNSCRPDILLVAFGPPRQEKWIYKYHKSLDAHIFLAIGSALDLISGRMKRAPEWMQNAGLEWLFRLSQEPRRLWKRYLFENTFFMYLILRRILKIMLPKK